MSDPTEQEIEAMKGLVADGHLRVVKSKRRKKRLLNGKLRPAVRRAKQKRAKRVREEWLANFEPGARDRFFKHVVVKDAVWLAAFERESGLDRAEAARTLEGLANERGWRKLRTLDGTVVGIAPSRLSRKADDGDA